jgi:hypothetical protein
MLKPLRSDEFGLLVKYLVCPLICSSFSHTLSSLSSPARFLVVRFGSQRNATHPADCQPMVTLFIYLGQRSSLPPEISSLPSSLPTALLQCPFRPSFLSQCLKIFLPNQFALSGSCPLPMLDPLLPHPGLPLPPPSPPQ